MNPRGSLRLALITLFVAPLAACSSSKGGAAQQAPSVPVTVAKAIKTSVPIRIEAIGTVEPYSTVAIKAQIGGVLQRVQFREGQDVRAGDMLFVIDPRPYQAALQAAQAALARDTAQMQTAKQDAARYTDLVKKEYVTQEEYDRILTNAAALEATVRADQAAVENATVQLEYC
ncbi:MAG TPA: efflux RND transporter periplasmic adaptor subunit, partial [Candidatus Polarisedimenticolia bacterium]